MICFELLTCFADAENDASRGLVDSLMQFRSKASVRNGHDLWPWQKKAQQCWPSWAALSYCWRPQGAGMPCALAVANHCCSARRACCQVALNRALTCLSRLQCKACCRLPASVAPQSQLLQLRISPSRLGRIQCLCRSKAISAESPCVRVCPVRRGRSLRLTQAPKS